MPGTTEKSIDRATEPPARKGRRFGVAFGSLTVLVALLLSGCGGSDGREGESIRLVIPPNATELTEAGRKVPGIPDRIRGTVGDVLEVVNRDGSTQFVAGYPVSPGQTLTIPLNRAGRWETECSVHEDDSLEMVIRPREDA